MISDSTIPMRANSILVYICRECNGELEVLLVSDESLLDWRVTATNVKQMELCWQAALSEVRKDTSDVPDRVYSVNKVETSYCVLSHAVLLSPIFVAFFDHDQLTTPMLPGFRTMWVKFKDADFYLDKPNQKETLTLIREEFHEKEAPESLKVYPNKF